MTNKQIEEIKRRATNWMHGGYFGLGLVVADLVKTDNVVGISNPSWIGLVGIGCTVVCFIMAHGAKVGIM